MFNAAAVCSAFHVNIGIVTLLLLLGKVRRCFRPLVSLRYQRRQSALLNRFDRFNAGQRFYPKIIFLYGYRWGKDGHYSHGFTLEGSLRKSAPRLIYSFTLRNLSALVITDTELKLIAAAAIIGESNKPKNGYSTPAAMGMPSTL